MKHTQPRKEPPTRFCDAPGALTFLAFAFFATVTAMLKYSIV
ncbi:MAG: hypothetical protein AAFX93_00280 [Verrucomicrobiota bacterium]